MKRHPDLRRFSDDHHQGLVLARRLRRAAAGEQPLDAAQGFLRFWREHTREHFREEEEVLLPVFARCGGSIEEESVARLLADHARIRGLVMELEDQTADGKVLGETLQDIGERLDAHIRLEERRVFPLIEASLPERALHEVSARLEGGDFTD